MAKRKLGRVYRELAAEFHNEAEQEEEADEEGVELKEAEEEFFEEEK